MKGLQPMTKLVSYVVLAMAVIIASVVPFVFFGSLDPAILLTVILVVGLVVLILAIILILTRHKKTQEGSSLPFPDRGY